MTHEEWMQELRTLAAHYPDADLDLPSPWINTTIRQSLVGHDAFWADRSAAGYTPKAALDEAIAEGRAS